MQILQITDTHLYGSASGNLRGVETYPSLCTLVDDAFPDRSALKIADYSAVLVTGDLVQDDPAGYLRFKSLFGNLRQPVLCIPGNHDAPAAMRRSLSGDPFRYCGTHSIGAWQFIMLDSYDPGRDGGRLAQCELDRLDHDLKNSPAHALVCLHHHPVMMGSRWLDGIGLANADEFWRVIDAHAHVRGVVWGHVHQEFDGKRKNVRLFATPSSGAQFLPMSDRFALDSRPPAYRRFELHDDGRIQSEIRWVVARPNQLAAAR